MKQLTHIGTRTMVAMQTALIRARHDRRGIEVLEWVLIAFLIAIGAYLAYQAAGETISDWLCNQVVAKFGGSC